MILTDLSNAIRKLLEKISFHKHFKDTIACKEAQLLVFTTPLYECDSISLVFMLIPHCSDEMILKLCVYTTKHKGQHVLRIYNLLGIIYCLDLESTLTEINDIR